MTADRRRRTTEGSPDLPASDGLSPEARARIEDLMQRMIPSVSEPRYRYWTFKVPGGAEWVFGWTTERGTRNAPFVKPDEAPGFIAFEVRYSSWTSPEAPGKSWSSADRVPAKYRATAEREGIYTRQVRFGLRWKAKDRAHRWHCARTGETYASLHTKSRREIPSGMARPFGSEV